MARAGKFEPVQPANDTPGSHELDDKQRAWMLDRYGERYVRVATHPNGFLGRAERRRRNRERRRHP